MKASVPINVTESGMVIEVREVHPKKALFLILVTPFGMVIDVREVHPKKVS